MFRSLFFILGISFFILQGCKPDSGNDEPVIQEKWYEKLPPKTGYAFLFNKKTDLNKLHSAVYHKYMSKTDNQFLSKLSFNFPLYLYIIQKDEKLKSFISKGIAADFEKVFNEIDGLYNGVNIYKAKYKNKDYFGIKTNEIIYISDSRINLENVIRQKNVSSDENLLLLQKTDHLLDRNADYNLVQFSNELKPDVFNLSAFKISPSLLSDIEAFDVVDATKQIYTGASFSREEKMMYIFKDISGVDHDIFRYIPQGFTKLSRFSFDDFAGFYTAFSSFFNYQALVKYTTKSLFNTLHSVNFFEENFNKGVILQFEDAQDFIKNNPYSDTYNSYEIYEVKQPNLIYQLFKPVMTPLKTAFFTVSDDYIIMAENKAYLKKLINDFENRNTLIFRKDFENFTDLFPSGAQFENLAQTEINDKKFFIYKSYTADDGNNYVNLLLQKEESKQNREGVEHLLTVSMDETPIIKPQLVYNHKHKTYRIIYQNQNNELVYKDLSGKELWRKKYKEKIIGKIFPVDIYRNGKIQYAFVTKDKWYIIDRYGRNVEGFPVSIKKEITRGLSVFDYDKNRKYRFGIVTGKKFYLYDKKGEKIKGFEYKPNDEISFSPEHFRIGNKDFILIQTAKGHLYILDRRGNIRIPLEENFEDLVKNWKVYNDKFINISKQNDMFTINLKGKVKKGHLGFDKPVKFDAISGLFAAVSDDKLILNNKTFDIPLGNYYAPYVYKMKGGKTLAFLSREDNNKIYAYHTDGKMNSYFPITGQQILDIKPLGNKNYLLSYDSDRNLMIYRFR
jgi:hypothetical protein